MLYIVYAESANYCGYGQHFVVEAQDEEDARDLTLEVSEDHFMEEDRDDLEEDGYGLDDTIFSNIQTIEPFGPEHDSWKFYQDPSQEQLYIKVNL